jgi:hypothetical protein
MVPCKCGHRAEAKTQAGILGLRLAAFFGAISKGEAASGRGGVIRPKQVFILFNNK